MTRTNKSKGLRPDFCFRRVLDIRPEWLEQMGVQGLLLDIDNTITRWENIVVPSPEMAWLESLDGAKIHCRLLSNGLARKKAAVAAQTGLKHVTGIFVKPFAQAFRQGLADLDLPAEQVMMIGDSVFTDVVFANRLGLWTSLVDPLSPVDFFGSKVYRLMERMLCLRRPANPSCDFRRLSGPEQA
jgi:uncharacterized protein